MKKVKTVSFLIIVFFTAVLLGMTVFSSTIEAQTAVNISVCLKALNKHKILKFKELSEAELQQLTNLTYGLSPNDVVNFLHASAKIIDENCPHNVTEYFESKFDSSFIMYAKKMAAQGSCSTLDECNKRGREFEQLIKKLNGGSAGIARANLADPRYASASPNATFESASYSVCCAGPISGKVNATQSGGGYCDERPETIYPCFSNTTDPLKDSDPGRAAFYSRFGKTRQLEEWTRKYGGGNLSAPIRSGGSPAARPAASGSSR